MAQKVGGVVPKGFAGSWKTFLASKKVSFASLKVGKSPFRRVRVGTPNAREGVMAPKIDALPYQSGYCPDNANF